PRSAHSLSPSTPAPGLSPALVPTGHRTPTTHAAPPAAPASSASRPAHPTPATGPPYAPTRRAGASGQATRPPATPAPALCPYASPANATSGSGSPDRRRRRTRRPITHQRRTLSTRSIGGEIHGHQGKRPQRACAAQCRRFVSAVWLNHRVLRLTRDPGHAAWYRQAPPHRDRNALRAHRAEP